MSENNDKPSSGMNPNLKNAFYVLLLILVAIIAAKYESCKGKMNKVVDSAFIDTKETKVDVPEVLYEPPVSDGTNQGRKKRTILKPHVSSSESTALVELCRDGVDLYYTGKNKGKPVPAKACVPAVAGKGGGDGANAENLKKAMARAAKAEQEAKENLAAWEAERRSRKNDNTESTKRIQELGGQITILLNDQITEEEKAEIRSQNCDDPKTSVVRITTDTDEWLLVESYWLSNIPDGGFHQPKRGQEGRNISWSRCIDVSEPFYLVLEMQVGDDEDPNFIQTDEAGNLGLIGAITIFADNYSPYPLELTEDDITSKEVKINYMQDGVEEQYTGWAFKIQFPKVNK